MKYCALSFVFNIFRDFVMFSRVFKFSSLTAVLLASTSSAFAADILIPPPPPPIVEMRSSIDWSGAYIGAAVGIASMHSLYLPSVGNDPELSGDSVTFTGLVGYNLQYDNIVIGVEMDITYANLKAQNRLDEVELDIPYIATARAKLGYSLGNTLLYVTGGIGVLEAKMTLTAFDESDRKTHVGYVVGGGIETMLSENLNVRLEYIFGDFGEETYEFTPGNVSEDINSLHMVRAGLVYNFSNDDGW